MTRTIVNGKVKEDIHLVSRKQDGQSILKGHINGQPIYVKHTENKLSQHVPERNLETVEEFLKPSISPMDRMPTPFVETISPEQKLLTSRLPEHDTLTMLVSKLEPEIQPEPKMPFPTVEKHSVSAEIPTITPFRTFFSQEAEPIASTVSVSSPNGMATEWFEPTIEYQDIPIKRKHRHTRRRKLRKQKNTRNRNSTSKRIGGEMSRKRV